MSANGFIGPVEDPKITIGLEVLTVKVGLLAELILSRAGLTFGDALQALLPQSKDARKFDITMKLFAACVAHNYKADEAPTADAWVAKIETVGGDPQKNAPLLAAIYTALSQAITKRWPSPPKAQEVTAPDEAPKAN